MAKRQFKIKIDRYRFLMGVAGLITFIIIYKLFSLQVINHAYYRDIAFKNQQGVMTLPAQRGEILIKDKHSGEEFFLATNTTLDMIYADPALIDDPVSIGETLAPIIFDLEEERELENSRIAKNQRELYPKLLNNEISEEEYNKQTTKRNDVELEVQHKISLIEKLSEKQRKEIILINTLDEEMKIALQGKNIEGIEIINNTLYAYPPLITNPKKVALEISDDIKFPASRLETILKGANRYIVLKRRLRQEKTEQLLEQIKEDRQKWRGIKIQEEYFRYYPEGSLGAQIIGYVDRSGNGQYGIENTFNKILAGVAGEFSSKKDSIGRQITVGDSTIRPAKDGDDIVLTIDRSIQMKMDEILRKHTIKTRADSGQLLVMNPKTGAILAISHFPTFDPNNFGDVFKRVEIKLSEDEKNRLVETKDENIFRYYTDERTMTFFLVFVETDRNGIKHYFKYSNNVGPEVYHNKAVAWPYEPGSVFKSIAMAIAIDDGDVTPDTKYNDIGPVGVDFNVYTQKYDFEIKNADRYMGLVDMKTVLAFSLNTGMTFVAKRIGPTLFHKYMEKFGFLEKTEIEFASEITGKIRPSDTWTESELATHSFGQGLTVNMIQMANAYSTIANGGILMQPHIVSEIRHEDGSTTKTEPKQVRRVLKEDTSLKMIAMLTNSVENGFANKAQVDGYYMAGKTGTSQTYKNGKPLTGVGTTITSFAGFGPVSDPKWVLLIKLDFPKTSEWSESTVTPAFQEATTFLYDYLNIPPDKK